MGGSSDEGAPRCNHVKKAVDVNKARKALRERGLRTSCSECEKRGDGGDVAEGGEGGIWVCLLCGAQLCGRGQGGHALQHFETPHSGSHALSVRLRPLPVSVYCYLCNRDVVPANDQRLRDAIDQLSRIASSGSPASPARESSLPLSIPLPAPSISSDVPRSLSGGRVRGLSNLGNTCFFNSVMQCLVQTPHLVGVLRQTAESGEEFSLAGGKMNVQIKSEKEDEKPEEKEVVLDPISGQLGGWGTLTEILHNTLNELQTPGRGDVFNPRKLFDQFVSKAPQFGGGDQHDSHELLRHLLEAVRSEDLRRYHSVILQKCGLDSKEKRNDIDDETKQKVKFYGQQASDAMLRPGQVFRGMLLSTLECQDCMHSSHTTEHFLDLSLPIMADKPQPPSTQRRKNQEEMNFVPPVENEKSKHQLKKERQATRKARKEKKRSDQNLMKMDDNQSAETVDNKLENKSSSEQSDADVEDNIDDNPKRSEDYESGSCMFSSTAMPRFSRVSESASTFESTANLENKEKCDKSPERLDKDNEENKYATIALPYKPLNDSPQVSNPDSGVASPETAKHALSDAINAESPMTSKELESPTSLSSEMNMDMSSSLRQSNNSPVSDVKNNGKCEQPGVNLQLKDFYSNYLKVNTDSTEEKKSDDNITKEFPSLNICDGSLPEKSGPYDPSTFASTYEPTVDKVDYNHQNKYSMQDNSEEGENEAKQSSDLSFNVSKRSARRTAPTRKHYVEEEEFSIQSCLNQFTSTELLTGNNKVGCELCTKRANNGKTVYTNATKRFRISDLPPVMILHLKRFQLGPRCILRKILTHVKFPQVLDVAPFCSDDIKKRANVSPNNKILYSLYGVVEHSGSMHLGHYVAYVKVRNEVKPGDPRFGFLPSIVNKNASPPLVNGNCNDDTDSSLSGYESGEGAVGVSEVEPPSGKWYYVSDSHVSETTEAEVLGATAYLLFYERIL